MHQTNHRRPLAVRGALLAAGLAAAIPAFSAVAGFVNDPAAQAAMQAASDSRAVWTDFHGFTAKAEVNLDGTRQIGTVRVTPEGEVTFDLAGDDAEPAAWATVKLRGVVSHRMAGDGSGAKRQMAFGDETGNPLGRLIKTEDTFFSSYRVRGPELTQVNRKDDRGSFSINVLEHAKLPDGRLLPRFFVVYYWAADGSLLRSEATREEYLTAGDTFLPARIETLTAERDTLTAAALSLTEHQIP